VIVLTKRVSSYVVRTCVSFEGQEKRNGHKAVRDIFLTNDLPVGKLHPSHSIKLDISAVRSSLQLALNTLTCHKQNAHFQLLFYGKGEEGL
jgi:hypothetical protein